MRVNRIKQNELDETLAIQAVRLWDGIWPDKHGRSIEERVDELRVKDRDDNTPEIQERVFHYVENDGALLAICSTFPRMIRFLDSGDEVRALALASVCVRRELRGLGLGRLIVVDAFMRLENEGFPLSLYQTGVPEFYRKLGAAVVENEFVNSLSQTDPEGNPWWDAFVMIYPGGANWSKGRVDLLGSGY